MVKLYYDLIIVARSTSDHLRLITQNCINSAHEECDNIILVETSGINVDYDNVDIVIPYNESFKYNRALNMGLNHAKGDIHILANNDIVFYSGWSSLGMDMIYNGFDSGSAWYDGCPFPRGDHVYEGYHIATHITGWCIFITQQALRKIGKLNEDMEFWYSDNAYAIQLKQHGLRHGLFCNVQIDHIGNQTLNTMPIKIKRYYSHGQFSKFSRLCGKKI